MLAFPFERPTDDVSVRNTLERSETKALRLRISSAPAHRQENGLTFLSPICSRALSIRSSIRLILVVK